jgi:hypothetical protein
MIPPISRFEELEAITIAVPFDRWNLRRKGKRLSYVLKSGDSGSCGIVVPV